MATLNEILAKRKVQRAAAATATAKPAADIEPIRPVRESMPVHTGGEVEMVGRELQSPEAGENLPDEWPGNGTDDYLWKQAYSGFASELRIIPDIASGWCWLAVVRQDKAARPILLCKLRFEPRFPGEGEEVPF